MSDSRYHLPIADMMSGLMMVFMFIAVAFMLEVQGSLDTEIETRKEATEARELAEARGRALERLNAELEHRRDTMARTAKSVEDTRAEIYRDLHAAFAPDLAGWDAEILRDTTVRFRSPDVLFESESAVLTNDYQGILTEFFPRYLKILYPHRDEIAALRIEGHSSRAWVGAHTDAERFLHNMRLSEERALATLTFCYRLIAVTDRPHQAWLHQALTATGRAFARPVVRSDGSEDDARSRRVEFKVVVRAEDKLREIRRQAVQRLPSG